MGKSALDFILVQRSRINPDANRHLLGRNAVAAHRITQAIVHLAEQPFAIDRHIAAAIEPRHLVLRLKRSEEHTSELQSLMRHSYAVFCLDKKQSTRTNNTK